jgi:hypothetical protein
MVLSVCEFHFVLMNGSIYGIESFAILYLKTDRYEFQGNVNIQ